MSVMTYTQARIHVAEPQYAGPMNNIDDLLAWLAAELARDAQMALDASASLHGQTLTGERWQWVDPVTDEVIPIAAGSAPVDDPVRTPRGGGQVSLRSVEEYECLPWPDHTGRASLPSFPVYFAEEVGVAAAAHIVEWAPARVLRQVAAQQAIVGALRAALARERAQWESYARWVEGVWSVGAPGEAPVEVHGLELAARHLAVVYADRPGYQPSWRP
jgi:hypothetical protein